MTQPLENKTILITRSANQAADFIDQLDNLGATTITFSLIENSPINQHLLVEKVSENNYDWLIFTSANAVQFFFETISPQNTKSKIAVVGVKTANCVKALGLNVDFMPTEFTAKQLAIELPLKEKETILIPCSALAKNDIVNVLEERKGEVEFLAIYDNVPVNYTSKELEIIFNKKIDYITFTSGSIVEAFVNSGIQIDKEKIICIGPETEKVAEQHNLKVTAIANPHSIEGMIEAIIKLKTPH